MKTRLTVVALFVVLSLVCPSVDSVHASGLQEDDARMRSVRDLLGEIGKEYGYYFTIEQLAGSAAAPQQLAWTLVARRLAKTGVESELDALRHDVSGFTYVVSRANPRVIHVIDSRLVQRSSYGMESVLTEFQYSGPTEDLVTALHDRGLTISPTKADWFGEAVARDATSKVTVKAERVLARDALTDFLDLRGRDPILWVSTTDPDTWISYVTFFGPPKHSSR